MYRLHDLQRSLYVNSHIVYKFDRILHVHCLINGMCNNFLMIVALLSMSRRPWSDGDTGSKFLNHMVNLDQHLAYILILILLGHLYAKR